MDNTLVTDRSTSIVLGSAPSWKGAPTWDTYYLVQHAGGEPWVWRRFTTSQEEAVCPMSGWPAKRERIVGFAPYRDVMLAKLGEWTQNLAVRTDIEDAELGHQVRCWIEELGL